MKFQITNLVKPWCTERERGFPSNFQPHWEKPSTMTIFEWNDLDGMNARKFAMASPSATQDLGRKHFVNLAPTHLFVVKEEYKNRSYDPVNSRTASVLRNPFYSGLMSQGPRQSSECPNWFVIISHTYWKMRRYLYLLFKSTRRATGFLAHRNTFNVPKRLGH
jgi:hypothetical protein